MQKKIKGFRIISSLLISGLFALPSFSQKGTADGSLFGKGADSVNCVRNLSLYSEFYKFQNYTDAIVPWREIYKNCPNSRESLYANGVNMYKAFIETETDQARKDALCDTIMMIYDQRIKYFGGEGSVLGRKGVDLLRYRGDEGITYIQEGYNYLLKSIDIEKDKSSPIVLTSFVSAGITLFKRGLLTADDFILDYVTATDILDRDQEAHPSLKKRQARESIDLNLYESNALTCDMIIKIFEPKFTANQNDPEFLKTVIKFLSGSKCEGETLFGYASEKLHSIEPSAFAAYKLARVFLYSKEYDKSAKYYLEAIELADEPEEKAKYEYELAYLYFSHMDQKESAAGYVSDALKLKPNWGDAYILLGLIYGSSNSIFEDPFLKKTTFWLAVDMFQKAKSVDPDVAEKANSLISSQSVYFPDVEDLFFNSLKEGQSFTVGGWINKTTKVRARKLGP
jgi:tetratricopeptide (TPR) repeat protein